MLYFSGRPTSILPHRVRLQKSIPLTFCLIFAQLDDFTLRSLVSELLNDLEHLDRKIITPINNFKWQKENSFQILTSAPSRRYIMRLLKMSSILHYRWVHYQNVLLTWVTAHPEPKNKWKLPMPKHSNTWPVYRMTLWYIRFDLLWGTQAHVVLLLSFILKAPQQTTPIWRNRCHQYPQVIIERWQL